MGEMTFKPDLGWSRNSIGRHRGSESGFPGERLMENKGKETENMGHVWGMLYCLVQKAYRLSIALFILGFSSVLF